MHAVGEVFLVAGGKGDLMRSLFDTIGSGTSIRGTERVLFLADAVTTSLAFELP